MLAKVEATLLGLLTASISAGSLFLVASQRFAFESCDSRFRELGAATSCHPTAGAEVLSALLWTFSILLAVVVGVAALFALDRSTPPGRRRLANRVAVGGLGIPLVLLAGIVVIQAARTAH